MAIKQQQLIQQQQPAKEDITTAIKQQNIQQQQLIQENIDMAIQQKSTQQQNTQQQSTQKRIQGDITSHFDVFLIVIFFVFLSTFFGHL